MKKLSVILLLAILFGACTKEMDVPTPNIGVDQIAKGPKVARLYAVKKAENASQSAVGVKSKYWPQESTIKIKFLNGEDIVKDKVKLYAKEWEELINLEFEWVADNETADVKIGFDQGDPDNLSFISWVTIGTDSRDIIPQNEPSINFVGFWDEETEDWIEDEEFIKAEILRAFGCMLGLGFEHKSPVTAWELIPPSTNTNKNRLRGYFGIYLPIEVIKERYLDLYTAEQTNHTAFDPTSIMVLPLSITIMKDPKMAVSGNSELSQTDKSFIASLYPRQMKVKYVMDIWSNSPTCLDKYDNLYFFNVRETLSFPLPYTSEGYLVSLMKMDAQTGVVAKLFDIPDEYYHVSEVAVDGQGNVYIVNRDPINWYHTSIIQFNRSGTQIHSIEAQRGECFTDTQGLDCFNEVSYNSIGISDDDKLYYVRCLSDYSAYVPKQSQLYWYNPNTQNSELVMDFNNIGYWSVADRGHINSSKTIFYDLIYIDTWWGDNTQPHFVKAESGSFEYSLFNADYGPDDTIANLARYWSVDIVGAGYDHNNLDLIRQFSVEEINEHGYADNVTYVHVLYDYDPTTNKAHMTGILPGTIVRPNGTEFVNAYYRAIGSTRNGKALYVKASPSSDWTNTCILKVTKHR